MQLKNLLARETANQIAAQLVLRNARLAGRLSWIKLFAEALEAASNSEGERKRVPKAGSSNYAILNNQNLPPHNSLPGSTFTLMSVFRKVAMA